MTNTAMRYANVRPVYGECDCEWKEVANVGRWEHTLACPIATATAYTIDVYERCPNECVDGVVDLSDGASCFDCADSPEGLAGYVRKRCEVCAHHDAPEICSGPCRGTGYATVTMEHSRYREIVARLLEHKPVNDVERARARAIHGAGY